MTKLERLRIFFLISVVVSGIFKIYIPGRQEFKRQEKITDSIVADYKVNSFIVDIPNFEKLSSDGWAIETYFDGTPLVRKSAQRTFVFIRDRTTGLIYKVESYFSPWIIGIAQADTNLWLKINSVDRKMIKGTLEQPIVVLQYGFGSHDDPSVSSEDYTYSVREYLTYKDYTPPPQDVFYYLNMIWAFVNLFGFALTTGLSIRRERAEKEREKVESAGDVVDRNNNIVG